MKVKLLLICLLVFAETHAQQEKSLVSNGRKLPLKEYVVGVFPEQDHYLNDYETKASAIKKAI